MDFSLIKATTIPEGDVIKIGCDGLILWELKTSYINQVPLSIDTDHNIFNKIGYMEGYRLSSSGTIKAREFSVVTGFIPATGGDTIRIFNCNWANQTNSQNYICAYDDGFNFIGALATVDNSDALYGYGADIQGSYEYDNNHNATIILAELSDIAYIRVNSRGAQYDVSAFEFNPADMVVTVNEEVA